MYTIRHYKRDFSNLTVGSPSATCCTAVSATFGYPRHEDTGRTRNARVIGPTTLLAPAMKDMGIRMFNDMNEGLKGVDAVIIMLRVQNERINGALLPSAQEFFKSYGLTPERLALAKPDAIVMHPGPMNRGVEIDSAVADGDQAVILSQVTYGIAVRMAVMSILAGD